MNVLGQGIYHIAADYLILLVDLAFERGISGAELLANSGLPEHILFEPNTLIGHESFLLVLNKFQALTDDLNIALEYGKRMTLSKHGALGFAAQYSATIDDATLKVMRYVETRAQMFDLVRQHNSHQRCLRINPRFKDESAEVFLSLAILSSVETICRTLTGHHGQNAHSVIHTTTAVDLSAQSILPNCQIISHSDCNSLTWPLDALAHPLPFFNPELENLAEKQLEQALSNISDHSELSYKIALTLRKRLHEMPTAEQVANELCLSSATLNRRLKAANTSFQQIKDTVRQQEAIRLLGNSRLSTEQIAEHLGFTDASNFAKAFKQWQGVTPSQYRKG